MTLPKLRALLAMGCLMVVPMTSPAEMDPAAGAVNALGVDLLRSMPSGENTVLSPYSIQSVLVMAYAGAAGVTATQMETTLHYPGPAIVEKFADLQRTLGKIEDSGEAIELAIAGRLFGQEGYPFLPEYLKLLKSEFDAPMEFLDFLKDSSGAEKTINSWVAKQTREKIREIIPKGALSPDTGLVLVNAVYFKAPWMNPFREEGTTEQPFFVSKDKEVSAPMMQQSTDFPYTEGKGYQAVALPYKNSDLQFVVILPEGSLESFESSLAPDLLDSLAKMPRARVNLSLPKMRLEPPLMELSSPLQKLGMKAPFNIPPGSADFSGIATRKPDDYLMISKVYHKTFVDVNEAGTEAAAATAAVMLRATSLPAKTVTMTVNRPFLFAIQHRPTGACLFLGRVLDPTKN